MRRVPRVRLVRGLAGLAVGLALVGAAPEVVSARTRATHTAGVTVAFGDGRIVRRTVSFTAGSISGIDALRSAGFGVEVYGYGTLGAAVCRIDGVGRAPDASCLNDPDGRYWSYFRNGTYSRAGAGSSRVEDGDQEQWSWGTGTSAPPTTAFPSATTVPPPTRPPPPTPAPTPSTAGPGGSTAPGATSTSAPPSTAATTTTRVDGEGPRTTTVPTEVVAEDEPMAETASGELASGRRAAPDDPGGSPVAIAGFALVLAAVLGLTLRARSARGQAPPRK